MLVRRLFLCIYLSNLKFLIDSKVSELEVCDFAAKATTTTTTISSSSPPSLATAEACDAAPLLSSLCFSQQLCSVCRCFKLYNKKKRESE